MADEQTPPEECPAQQTCSMHRAATEWLAADDVMSLRTNMDIFWTLRLRAWSRCTCGMFSRITKVLGLKSNG